MQRRGWWSARKAHGSVASVLWKVGAAGAVVSADVDDDAATAEAGTASSMSPAPLPSPPRLSLVELTRAAAGAAAEEDGAVLGIG